MNGELAEEIKEKGNIENDIQLRKSCQQIKDRKKDKNLLKYKEYG